MADVDRRAGWTPDDETLEYAARLIEETDFSDLRGCMADTKAGQLEFELRYEAREETRRSAARLIRAMQSRADLDARAILKRIVDDIAESKPPQAMYLIDAWPLAWNGWLNIECHLKCNSNSVPPSPDFTISLTDKGRAVLDGYVSLKNTRDPE